MPEEQVVDNQDLLTDPLSDNSDDGQLGTEDPQADPTAQAGADDPIQQVEEEFDFGGLPYKDLDSAVTGHKSLQTEHLRVKTQLFKVQQQMKEILPLLKNLKEGGTKEEVEESVDDFLNRFVQDPKGVLQESNKQPDDPRFATILGELTANRVNTATAQFSNNHPELDANDEAALEQILMSNPRLTNLGDNPTIESIIDSLETALAHHIKSNPGVYATKLAKIRETKEAGLNDAKAAAGVGGKGGSIADGQANRDAFDDILDSETERMAQYGR
jgi:hypothetical protein|tara:strand:+ start:725 stop:1543 length:819 start_codon:yes stop_codon:yes gene_type:complete